MSCPPEIADILLSILETGLLRTRAAGWAGDSRRCTIEADHVHNLTELLSHYSAELLSFYWDVERPAFRSQVPEADQAGFAPLWNQLARHVSGATEPASAR
jgi:hypothetical protein